MQRFKFGATALSANVAGPQDSFRGKMMRGIRLRLLVVGLLIVPTAAEAQAITNGSLTGACNNGGVPTGWSTQAGSPDVVDLSCNIGVPATTFAAPASSSPDGGTWVGLGREGSFIERFGQNVAGFTIGQSYTLSWYVSNFGSNRDLGYINPNQIEFFLSGVSAGTGSLRSLGEGWFAESVIFVATAASHDLAFQLGNTDLRSYMGIDGIALAANGSDVVPEPATMTLLATGLAGMAAARRRRKKA